MDNPYCLLELRSPEVPVGPRPGSTRAAPPCRRRPWAACALIWVTLLAGGLIEGCYRDDSNRAPRAAPGHPQSAAAVVATTPADLFARHCALCHGAEGRGDGPAAYLVYPPPRDFTTGVYRFKSTPGNQLPTDTDLRRVIKGGIDRTAMPSFAAVFSDQQIDELGRFVLSMQRAVPLDAPREAITPPARPQFTAALAEAGKSVYMAGGCAACHGEGGRGDGPSAATLRDADGWLLPPADFTTGLYKAGRTPEALYRVIHLGVPGTPMPGFAEAIKQGFEAEGVGPDVDLTWAMVAYLDSLVSRKPDAGVASGATITAAPATDEAMLGDPRHDAWGRVQSVSVSLRPIWQRRIAAPALAVRAVTFDGRVAIALDWPDAKADLHGGSVHRFADAAAVMFSLSDDPPALAMGQRGQGPANPKPDLVNLWHWRADRQLNADTNRLHDVVGDDAPAGSFADLYLFKTGDRTAGPITEHDSTYVPAWNVNNPKANPALLRRSVLESNAWGFGTLTLQSGKDQAVDARAVWVDGRWRVVMVRSLAANDEGDVALDGRSTPAPVAFAVWDGAAGDRDGTKLYSGWHWLRLK